MKNSKKLTKWDVVALAVIMLFYSFVSFIDLGDSLVPTTQPDMGSGDKREYITYAVLNSEAELGELLIYKGLGVCGVTVYKYENEGWQEIARAVCKDIYEWNVIPLEGRAQTLCVSVGGDSVTELYEAAFLSADGSLLAVNTKDCLLFDEQELVPQLPSYQNGMYFDENYHARTAYEHIKGITPYEITHPPLGKILISVGIGLFGMNPFGWRFMGNIFGILMLAVIYVFAKRIFASTYFAFAATLFLALDFMHFTQTRIGLIDSFAVFFILLAYYFMYLYYDSGAEELPQKRALVILALCGIAFGLGIASKWIALYGGLGLAVLFTASLVRRTKEGEKPQRTCMWCLLFFIAVPFVIYFASYIPYYTAEPEVSAWKIFWDNQKYMLAYHGGLETQHDFESVWYTWPLVYRPIWYYGSKELAYEGLCSTIVAMGNPAVWWCGSASLLFLLFKPKKQRSELFIIAGALSQYIPWAFISRSTFIYHFFASVPFIILALTATLKMLAERFKPCKAMAPALLVTALVLFVLFYPVISGCVADRGYVLQLLTWFDSWKLCY